MNCPTCGRPMSIGTPHGPGVAQWECRACNKYVPISGVTTTNDRR